MSWLRSLRRPAAPPSAPAVSRRQFLMGPAGALRDEDWDAIEARAAQFGIVPGTVVDAQGRSLDRAPGFDPFLGMLMIVGFNFAPRGWAFCDGQLLSIASYESLFSLLGTTFGGDGRTTFALPDLRGRSALGEGRGVVLSDRRLGERGGAETHTLTVAEMPDHTHTVPEVLVRGAGTQIVGATSGEALGGSVSGAGAGQAHDNMPPFLALNYCIALTGLFPSRS